MKKYLERREQLLKSMNELIAKPDSHRTVNFMMEVFYSATFHLKYHAKPIFDDEAFREKFEKQLLPNFDLRLLAITNRPDLFYLIDIRMLRSGIEFLRQYYAGQKTSEVDLSPILKGRGLLFLDEFLDSWSEMEGPDYQPDIVPSLKDVSSENHPWWTWREREDDRTLDKSETNASASGRVTSSEFEDEESVVIIQKNNLNASAEMEQPLDEKMAQMSMESYTVEESGAIEEKIPMDPSACGSSITSSEYRSFNDHVLRSHYSTTTSSSSSCGNSSASAPIVFTRQQQQQQQPQRNFVRDPRMNFKSKTPVPTGVLETPQWISAMKQTRDDVLGDLRRRKPRWRTIHERSLEFDLENVYIDSFLLEELLNTKDKVFASNYWKKPEHPYRVPSPLFGRSPWSMKMANIDSITEFLLSGEKEETMMRKNPTNGNIAENVDRDTELFYFADVCGGPGGFSQYMLWRKGFYNAKGFGITLKETEEDDWKLSTTMPRSGCFFERFYGRSGTGDIRDPEIIVEFEEYIKKETNGLGVKLMMSDAHIVTKCQDNIQEILSKRLYLCEMLLSLCIVSDGGNYVSTLFDIYTPFSVGLIYLMYICYDRISLHKPLSCAKANSERFIICQGLKKECAEIVKEYLKEVNQLLHGFSKEGSNYDINFVVPEDLVRADINFVSYVITHNVESTNSQIEHLEQYLSPPNYDRYQLNQLRDRCLRHWKVPEKFDTRYLNKPLEVVEKYTRKKLSEDEFTENLPFFGNSCDSKMMVSVSAQHQFVWDGFWIAKSIRVPSETILLIDELPLDKNGVIRVLDAAVIFGDNVSQLPLDDRRKAAKKMCLALRSEYSGDKGYRLEVAEKSTNYL